MRLFAIYCYLFLKGIACVYSQSKTLTILGQCKDKYGGVPDHVFMVQRLENKQVMDSVLIDVQGQFVFQVHQSQTDTIVSGFKCVEPDISIFKPFALGPCPWDCKTQYIAYEQDYFIMPKTDTFKVQIDLDQWLVDYNMSPSMRFRKNDCRFYSDTITKIGLLNNLSHKCYVSILKKKAAVNLISYVMEDEKNDSMAKCRAENLRLAYLNLGIDNNKINIIIRKMADVYPAIDSSNSLIKEALGTYVNLQFWRISENKK
jgi:hypothetical protein